MNASSPKPRVIGRRTSDVQPRRCLRSRCTSSHMERTSLTTTASSLSFGVAQPQFLSRRAALSRFAICCRYRRLHLTVLLMHSLVRASQSLARPTSATQRLCVRLLTRCVHSRSTTLPQPERCEPLVLKLNGSTEAVSSVSTHHWESLLAASLSRWRATRSGVMLSPTFPSSRIRPFAVAASVKAQSRTWPAPRWLSALFRSIARSNRIGHLFASPSFSDSPTMPRPSQSDSTVPPRRCSEPGHRVAVAIVASRGPGR